MSEQRHREVRSGPHGHTQCREIWFQCPKTLSHPSSSELSQDRGLFLCSQPGRRTGQPPGGGEGKMRGCGGRLQCPQISEDPGLLCVLPKRAGSSPAESAASRRVWEGVPLGPHLGARQPRCGGACGGPHHPVQHGSLDRSKPQLAQQGTGWNLPQSAWVGIL